MTLDLAVFVGARAAPALAERVALVEEATGTRALVLGVDVGVKDAVASARRRRHGAYLLDANRPTAMIALALMLRRVPFVLDTGDDPYSLALGLGLGRRSAAVRRATESWLLRQAVGVVCRGHRHRQHLLARTSGPVAWHPDTAPDWLFAEPLAPGDDRTLCTFGSTGPPRSAYPHVYGEEVVDAVALTDDLRGILIGRGPGLAHLRARGGALAVGDRLELYEDLPLPELARQVERATFLTSLQSDDRAGWVRTTGKLPLALALGRCLLASDVGEAARVLPPELRLPGKQHPASEIVAAVRRGAPQGWPSHARALAETYRRSRVAGELRDTLCTWLT